MQDLTGPPTSSLSGVVFDELRQPLPGAMVFLAARGQAPVRTTMAGADGAYRLRDIAPDIDFELWAEHREQSSAATVFRVGGPGERVTIELQVAARIRFEEAANSGLDFVLRNGAANGFHMPELMVGGVAAFDYNGDGCVDIFFPNGATSPALTKTGVEFHNRLFRNQCDMTFVDVTERTGVAGEGYSIGAAAADYDNDGHIDLFVAGVNSNILYHNLGNGTFKNVTQQARVAGADLGYGKMWSNAAGWFDYDRDGWLDLFVVNYVDSLVSKLADFTERPC